jgi:hypothetical protein
LAWRRPDAPVPAAGLPAQRRAAVCCVGRRRGEGGLVCRPEQWGGKQVLRILALTGWEMDAWLPALKSYRQWPAALDVKSVVFEGREGWKRMLPEARVVRSIYEVRIDGKA